MTQSTSPSSPWNDAWKERQRLRRAPDDAAFWDERSKTFATKDAPSPYVDRFLELAAVRPGESVFDMGCGTGALALPLAAAGHPVTAADFSAGMLGVMDDLAAERGVTGIKALQMSWEADWATHGVGPRSHDVCVASRSIATSDLEDSLLKLTAVARRRVGITLTADASPRVDSRALRAAELPHQPGEDFQFAFNILVDHGLRPEVAYISSERDATYATPQAARDDYEAMVRSALSSDSSPAEEEAALAHLRTWLDDQLIPNERAGQPDRKGVPEGAWRLREPRVTTWAFLAWNV